MGTCPSKEQCADPDHRAVGRGGNPHPRRDVHERIGYPVADALRDLEKWGRGKGVERRGRWGRREVHERVAYPMMDGMREWGSRRRGGGWGGGWDGVGEERRLGRGWGVGERMGRYPGGWRWGV